jgi:hypothetical protein
MSASQQTEDHQTEMNNSRAGSFCLINPNRFPDTLLSQEMRLHLCLPLLLRRPLLAHSVWTVDLAHLLAHFGAHVMFCTITIGINGDFANETFYMENLEDDEHRVQQLFAQAYQLGEEGS